MNNSALPNNTVFCIICHQAVSYGDATAGSLYADNTQAFACNAHIAERVRWTLAWIAFDVDQHLVRERTAQKSGQAS